MYQTGEDSSRCEPKWTCGQRKHRDEEIMGRYGAGTRNKEGSMAADFAKRMDLAIVNSYFKKKHEQKVPYKSGEKKYPGRLCDVQKEEPEGNVRL